MPGNREFRSDAEVVGSLFARAPFEKEGWNTALQALRDVTGSSRAQLLALGSRFQAFNWATDTPPEYEAEFIAAGGLRADVNYRVGATRAPMELTWEAHYDQVRQNGTDEAYLDHVRKYDAEFGAQIVLSQRPGMFFGLAVLHGPAEGRTTETQRAILETVAPEVLAAIRMQDAIEHQGIALLRGSLEAFHSPAILLDALGKVCDATESARNLLGPGTLQIREGVLRAPRPDLDRLLQGRIVAALAGQGEGAADLWLRSETGLLLVDVRTLPRQEWSFGFAPRVIVTLRAPLGPAQAQARTIGSALGLTLAEGEVVALLAHGHSRQQVATLRGVSVQTVISQLRTIFQKCGVNREAELVALARAVMEMGPR
ncbi:helix-turn-helix transcriptional regulator [Novosphingobium sp. BL-8H]|uniref:helix-turn-helix transcriptional regulator n=1 Tax=Novosphingobium sp. BL-8H TaxID=3127640 RepID=UPI00375698F3